MHSRRETSDKKMERWLCTFYKEALGTFQHTNTYRNFEKKCSVGTSFWSATPSPDNSLELGAGMRSRSRSRRNGLLGAGAGVGAVKNGAAPALKRDTIVKK